ncbi:MAG: hypothetical protein GX613_17060 [Chloroflexi bacterium]|nr:hypothetical protein [Chloroflexota bacterium]
MMTLETLGEGWLSGCGMVALLLLAVITSVVAVVQLRSLLRQRGQKTQPGDRRQASLGPLMTLAIALVFWLLFATTWLFQSMERGFRSPWLR